jgi:hypothetical protein
VKVAFNYALWILQAVMAVGELTHALAEKYLAQMVLSP